MNGDSSNECGVLYMATGEKFINEATRSAESVHKHMDVPTAIATDERVDSDAFDIVIERDFETEAVNGRDWLLNSCLKPGISPFERTLYLDSDTLVRTDVSELFDLLDDYELAVARVPDKPRVDELPDTWTTFNCGVIAYRESQATTQLFDDWRQRYREDIKNTEEFADQPAFTQTLFDSDIRWYCLPPEYNVRLPRRGCISSEVKIAHGRHRRATLESMADEIDRVAGPRVFRERSNLIKPTHIVRNRGSFRYHAETALMHHGPTTLVRVTVDYLSDRLLGTERMKRHGDMKLG